MRRRRRQVGVCCAVSPALRTRVSRCFLHMVSFFPGATGAATSTSSTTVTAAATSTGTSTSTATSSSSEFRRTCFASPAFNNCGSLPTLARCYGYFYVPYHGHCFDNEYCHCYWHKRCYVDVKWVFASRFVRPTKHKFPALSPYVSSILGATGAATLTSSTTVTAPATKTATASGTSAATSTSSGFCITLLFL